MKNTQYEDNIQNHPTLKTYYEYHLPFYEKLFRKKSKIKDIEIK